MKLPPFKREMEKHLLGEVLTDFATATFNWKLTMPDCELCLRRWARRLHVHFLRRAAFRGVLTERYFRFYAFLEWTDCGAPHYHIAMFADPTAMPNFFDIAAAFWQREAPHGDLLCRDYARNDGHVATTRYCLKDLANQRCREGFTTSYHLLPRFCRLP